MLTLLVVNYLQFLSYPEEAGSPLGGEGFSRYVMLEVHYNNPEHKAGM